jgi:allantoin racemase
MPRILLLNANTTHSVTQLVEKHARLALGDKAELIPVTASFGAHYISSEAAYAVAGHAALDALAAAFDSQQTDAQARPDAVLLACFGDPGLFALREMSPVPVVGMAEASMRAAAAHGRYSIVTGGVLWKVMLARLAHALELDAQLASIRPISLTGDQIASDPDAALKFLAEEANRCAREDGAQAVILGGAALAGLAARIQDQVNVPVIDSVYASAVAALSAAQAAATASHRLAYALKTAEPRRAVPSTGLSTSLTHLLDPHAQ